MSGSWSGERADPLAGLPPEIREAMRQEFLEEAATLTEDLESSVLSLEREQDAETINAAFRAAHTMKGSAAGVGMFPVSEFMHGLEDVMDAVRHGKLALSTDVLGALLEGVDHARTLLRAVGEGGPLPDLTQYRRRLETVLLDVADAEPVDEPAATEATAATEAMSVSDAGLRLLPPLSPDGEDDARVAVADGARIFGVRFIPALDTYRRGLDPLALLQSLAEDAQILSSRALLDDLPSIEDLDPLDCRVGHALVVATKATREDLEAIFEFGPAGTTVEILQLDPDSLDRVGPYRSAPAGASGRPRLGEILIQENLVTEAEVEAALDLQASGASEAKLQAAPASDDRSVRIRQAKVDALIDLVGGLVTARNELLHITRLAEDGTDAAGVRRRLKETGGAINRAVTQLQADILGLRMTALRTTFQRMPRIVRDVAAGQEKRIELETVGDEVEVDKTIAEGLTDPLVHLLRNAADHGIEPPAERRLMGKPEVGKVRVSARREASSIVIEVSDDGRGMSPDAMRRSAVSKGVIDPEAAAALTDAESLDLIFRAGFSTTASVSEFSGRGVGMDVVRTSVARLGGQVSVSSTLGVGTTVRLRLPLTLSVFRALLVQAGAERYAIPLDAVAETTSVPRRSVETLDGHPMTTIGGILTGLVHLSRALGFAAEPATDIGTRMVLEVVTIDVAGMRLGMVVDALEQPQEIMVKPIDRYLSAGGALAGAAMMGDGSVALVLEPLAAVRGALSRVDGNSAARGRRAEGRLTA